MWKILFLILFLVGCQTPTKYAQAPERGEGYRDLKVASERYRISFNGNSATTKEKVDIYLLYRAAELTLAEGADYFVVNSEDKDNKYSLNSPGFSTGIGFGGRRSFGFGAIASNTDVTERPGSVIFISVFKGTPPADNPRAYAAAEVKQNLEGKIDRPTGKK